METIENKNVTLLLLLYVLKVSEEKDCVESLCEDNALEHVIMHVARGSPDVAAIRRPRLMPELLTASSVSTAIETKVKSVRQGQRTSCLCVLLLRFAGNGMMSVDMSRPKYC